MPEIIDPGTINVDDLPGIWSPVQWELSEAERSQELEEQAIGSLLWVVDTPEALLRLLLGETDIERAYEPPAGYNPQKQGEWDSSLVTFQFKRPIHLVKVERQENYMYIEFKVEDSGYWSIEIEPEKVTIQRL